nr:MAG TPA: protein-turn-helix DNA binding protein [Caudoviricetes sp.]
MTRAVIRDRNFIKNVDFTRLSEILEEKRIRNAELSRRCGYYPEYVAKHVFGEKKLNWTVANTLERVYDISLDEYCYEKTEKSTSNDGQLALRLDEDLIAEKKTSNDGQLSVRVNKDLIVKFRNYAFYNELSQKEAIEKILSEYLDGKKTATTASNDDTAETAISDNDIKETTANGEFLKRLELASKNKHISIEDFIFDCILKGLKQEEN